MMRLIAVLLVLVAAMAAGPAEQAHQGAHGAAAVATASTAGVHDALCGHHGGAPGCSVAPALPPRDAADSGWSRGPAFDLPAPPGRYMSPAPDSRFRPPAGRPALRT